MEKVVVITGGSSGFGKYFRDRYIADGATVWVLSRSNPDQYQNFIKCDVSNANDVKTAMTQVAEHHGRIDILVNNAGMGITGAIELMDDETVKKSCDINFLGVFYSCKYALPHIPRGGRIINISSITAYFALPFKSIYCANKAAVSSLSHALRMELADSAIQVTALCPGEAQTGFSKNRIINVETNARYGARPQNVMTHIEQNQHKRMTLEYCGGKMYKIMTRKRLKPSYIIGNVKHMANIAKVLPLGTMLKAVNKMLGGYKE